MENKTTEKIELQRFTTLVNPKTLSDIKLISYFTNLKLYECIEQSMRLYIKEFETKNDTSISSIISLRDKFTNTDNSPLNPKEEKDKK